MSIDEQLEHLIEQTIQGAVATIPVHFEEIEQNKKTLKVSEPKEFAYGLIIGMGLGMASALMTTITSQIPTVEEQIKVRDMIYKKIPHI
jgi:molecular chaperone DnaK (HSP70)